MLNENNFNVKFTIRSAIDAIKWFKSQIQYIMNPSKDTLVKSVTVAKAFTENKNLYDTYKALKGLDKNDKKGQNKKEDDLEEIDSNLDPETGLPLSEEKKSKAQIEEEKRKEILSDDNNVTKFEVGKMYLFHYDPKTKVKLPYYDTFPIIIMVQLVKGGFYGINFHYLPIKMRMLLLSNLLSFSVLKDGELERLRISYDILSGAGNSMEPFKPCFKHYLYDHIRGVIKGIPTSDWGYAVALPFENFKKKSKQEVWRDSMDSLN